MTHTVSRTISDATLSRIIDIESAGRPTVKAPTSSATGLLQFIEQTWFGVMKKAGAALGYAEYAAAIEKTPAGRWTVRDPALRSRILNLRKEPEIAINLGARFEEDNAAALGAGWTDGDLYLAHFAGAGTARKLLRAPPATPCEKIFTAAAIQANRSILEGKTAGQVRAWASRKMAKARTDWVQHFMGGAPAAEEPETYGEPLHVDEPEPMHGKKNVVIELAQKRLKAMKYHEVGFINGEWGGRTAAAISAFYNDRGITRVPAVDDELLAALDAAEAEGFVRPISRERAEGVPEGSRQVDANQKNGTVGIVATVTALITGITSKLGEWFEPVRDMVDTLRPVLRPLQSLFADHWPMILFGAGAFVLWQSGRAYRARVEDHQEGRTT